MATKSKKISSRLTKDVLPKHYQLSVHPDLDSFTFAATEIITIELSKATKSLTLHSKDIEILSAFWERGKQELDAGKISYNTKNETVTFSFTKPIPKGSGKLHLEFRGLISEKLRGFYRSKYLHNGQTKHLATTQFESTDARRAFPCFDEPSHKAVFELSLIVPNHLTAISNTVEKPDNQTPAGIDHDENLKVIHFEPTPKMSTYLLAYMVGEFESIETKTKDGVIIRVFTTPGKKQHAKFAMSVAKRSLEFLNSYFDIPYPLPVLDMIAIPDFSAGAMENWGAVTYRESAILVDENHTAFATKQQVAETVAHELVHQWFGNLVTMEWWTHLWLNESFASFMSYIVLDELFPKWNIWTRFVLHDHASALHLDSLENTHPIEVEVHHPNQISEIFDAISYDKGASVLRMLLHYIGPDDFRDGLRYYLKKHSYKNTESIHLWQAFEKVSKKPIAKFMHTWVSKPGYPFVAVAETKSDQISVIQNQFTLSSKVKNKEKTIWPVPLQLPGLEILNTKTARTNYLEEYIKLNLGETGFFRTLYSPSLLAKLYKPVHEKTLSKIDRFGIIRDLFAMTKSGLVPTSAYLEFLKAYKDEDSYIIWAEILSGMKEIYNLFSTEKKIQSKLTKYYLDLIRPVAKKVGWQPKPNEDLYISMLRGIVLGDLGFYGDTATLKKAKQVFTQKKLDPNLRAAVYQLVGLSGNQATAKKLQKMYNHHHLQEEQRQIARSLMSFQDKTVLRSNLEFVLSKHVRTQDAPIYIAQALLPNQNRKIVWQWVKKNWKIFDQRYRGDHLLVWVIKGLGGLTTKEDAKDIIKFFKSHPTASVARTLKQSIEQINHKAEWLKRDKLDCNKFLSQL